MLAHFGTNWKGACSGVALNGSGGNGVAVLSRVSAHFPDRLGSKSAARLLRPVQERPAPSRLGQIDSRRRAHETAVRSRNPAEAPL